MPVADNTTAISVASRKRCDQAKKLGLPIPQSEWGPFRPLRAFAAIEACLKGHAQHVAFVLARRTPIDGVIFIAHKDLSALTGRPPEAITIALENAINAGLLHGRKTRDGFMYTWAESVYKSNGAGDPRTLS